MIFGRYHSKLYVKNPKMEERKKESPALHYWTPFIQNVQDDLDLLHSKLKSVCDEYGNGKRRRRSPAKSARGFSPHPPNEPRVGLSRRTTATPSIRKNSDPSMRVSAQSNYRNWPIRGNASARIYKPHKLEYAPYRNEKKIVPVLNGERLETYTNRY